MKEETKPVNDKPLCLHLPLITKWFEMTSPEEKSEDYREITPHWIKRLVESVIDEHGNKDKPIGDYEEEDYYRFVFKKFEINKMTLGYPSNTEVAKIKNFEHKGIEIRTGKPEWGAKPDKLYFVIKHGVRIL